LKCWGICQTNLKIALDGKGLATIIQAADKLDPGFMDLHV